MKIKARTTIGWPSAPPRSAGQARHHDAAVIAFVYLTATLDAATWGAELALGEGPGRIYVVEPTGPIEDDPNLTARGSRATRPSRITPGSRSG